MCPTLAVHPPLLSTDILTTKATRQKEEKELRASTSLGIKNNLAAANKQQILRNLNKKQQSSVAETHQSLQAHFWYSEIAASAVDKEKERVAWKANEAAAFSSITSPSNNDIATMAAEVVRQKKEKERSEQTKINANFAVETGDGANAWAAKQQRKEDNARLLSAKTERLKKTLRDGEREPTEDRSSSVNDMNSDASYNNHVTNAPCRNPQPPPVGSQTAQPHQSTFLLAVNQVAKHKPQRLEAKRKPSKLSLAVAAAAQHRASTNHCDSAS